MKHCVLISIGAAGLVIACGGSLRFLQDEARVPSGSIPVDAVSAPHPVASVPVPAIQEEEERWAAPITPDTAGSSTSSALSSGAGAAESDSVANAAPQEDTVRRLLHDVASGRLVLDTTEEGFDALDLSRPDAVPVIVRLWAQQDYAEATRWTEALPESGLKAAALRQIAMILGQSDPAAALAWIDQLTAGPSRDAALESLSTEFASANPERAMQLTEELPPGRSRDQTSTHIFSQWAAQDPSAAVASARALKDPAARSAALAAVATAWAEGDPVAAGTLAAEEIDDPAAQARAVVSIVQRWAQKDPAAAAAWVQNFDAGDLSNTAVEQLVTLWSLQDAEAPLRWLSTLPNAGVRDAGLASLARALASSQPAQAAQCAALITDPLARQRSMVALGNH